MAVTGLVWVRMDGTVKRSNRKGHYGREVIDVGGECWGRHRGWDGAREVMICVGSSKGHDEGSTPRWVVSCSGLFGQR